MEKQIRKKKIITAILLLMLIAVYAMIFAFSSDDAQASSAVSTRVTKWLVHVYYKFCGGTEGSGEIITAASAELEGSIRKLAHFTEYMAVGFLSFGIAVMWIRNTGRNFLTVVIQLVISAGLDEMHQYFVPGRHSSVRDVLIDTAGGITGIIIILCIKGIKKQWNHIRQPKSKTCS